MPATSPPRSCPSEPSCCATPAAIDTERERAAFQEQADALNWATLAEGEHRERTREQAAAARALSEQINANLREPPLTE